MGGFLNFNYIALTPHIFPIKIRFCGDLTGSYRVDLVGSYRGIRKIFYSYMDS